MSKKHGDRILAALDLCNGEDEIRSALAFLAGYLSAEVSQPNKRSVTAEKLAVAFEKAAGHAKGIRPSWRSASEPELPEPRDAGTLHSPMPGNATRLTRCLVPLISENGARTALNRTDVTCVPCLEEIEKAERRGEGVAQLRAKIRPLAEIEREGQEELVIAEAEAVVEGWTPGPELVAMVEADRAALPDLAAAVVAGSTPVHSGPCIYCKHGPGCVTCDLTQGAYWGKGPAGREYPGPVCGLCSVESKRREIAADPYYNGDYVAMFGDDE